MLKIIMSMFDKAQAKFYQMGKFGAPIGSIFGVLQGGILSPKLFNEFMYFTHLLYADDIVLMSGSATGLQSISIPCTISVLNGTSL